MIVRLQLVGVNTKAIKSVYETAEYFVRFNWYECAYHNIPAFIARLRKLAQPHRLYENDGVFYVQGSDYRVRFGELLRIPPNDRYRFQYDRVLTLHRFDDVS